MFCKPTQVGGTESLNNMLGYIIAQDPASTLIVYPTLELAEFVSKNRLQPMVDLSAELKRRYRLRESKDLELQFEAMYLVLAGANSPASLASRPIRYLLLDEVDKYPAASGREADPISLARERTKTFPANKKIFLTSTPTVKSGNIWQAMLSADVVNDFHVPCPHCGHYQILRFKQIKWPKGMAAEEVTERAHYECEGCGGAINDSHKPAMLRNGQWRPRGKRPDRVRKVAYHINTIYSPWIRFGDVAYTFLKAKDFPDLLRNFVNSWLAEPWEDTQVKMNRDTVLERQTEFEAGVVPDWTLLLTGGIDVQENSMYWTIRAWGVGMTSANIAHGHALCFEDVEQVMNAAYKKPDGSSWYVNLCAIDSGDQTEMVYDLCAMNQDWLVPVKGSSHKMLTYYSFSNIDKVNSRAHGMRLYIVSTDKYKDMIAARLNRPPGRGAWMVHKDCDEDYAEQITAEHKVIEKRGNTEVEVWKPKTSTAANHYLDTEVYCAVAADLLQVRYLQEPEPQPEPRRPEPEQPQDDYIRSGDWIKEGKGWL